MRTKLEIALQRSLGGDIRLLQIDAPILEVGQRDGLAGYSTNDEVAGLLDPELAMQIRNAGLAFETEQPFKPIHAWDLMRTARRCRWLAANPSDHTW